jgi:hypothetical protein
MIVAPIIGLIAIRLTLRGIVRGASGVGRTAVRLAKRGVRHHSVGFIKAAAYLAAIADWPLGKRG